MALVMGVGPGVAVAGVNAAQGESAPAALLSGLVVALVVGPVLGLMVRRQVRRQAEAVGVLDGRTRRAAGRASLWGPVPEDPEVRRAAHALATHALAESQRRPILLTLGALLFVGMSVWLAVVQSPWWWLSFVLWAGMLVWGRLVLPTRLHRRAEMLWPEES